MADGDYERRTAHDAEMKRLERIIRESRERQANCAALGTAKEGRASGSMKGKAK